MATKNKFTKIRLDWARKQLESWMAYVDANPYEKMEDRTKLRPTKNGGTILEVVATIEAQQKSVRETLKDYYALLEVADRLENAEAAAGSSDGTYGDVKESLRMRKKRTDTPDDPEEELEQA